MNQPIAPGMINVGQQYTPQQFGVGYNPWSNSAQGGQYDPSMGITANAGQNGYQGGYTIGSVTDPYAASIQSGENQATGAANAYNSQMPGMMQELNSSMQGMQQYQQSTSAYPSYPNIAGAGSQTAGMGIPQMQVPPMQGTGDSGYTTDMATNDTSHGFNPWSLQGEAMTRVK